jgi:endonuclease YncB( thermonuclease family)
VQFSNYDAPEEGKKGYKQAKQKLENLIKNKEVKIETEARDKWGRAIANVYDGRESANKKMRGK